jgi:hypothetical protein
VSASSSHINTTPQNSNPNSSASQNIACSAPMSNLITMQPVTTVERCPTCNQLKTLSISSANNPVQGLTSPSAFLNMGNSNKQMIPPAYNPLTASSSLSSSTSSINSSNKQIQQQQQQPAHNQPINIPQTNNKY